MNSGSTSVLIAAIPHGASHQRAASAVAKALLGIRPDLPVTVINALDYCPRWFRAYYNSYTIPLNYFPPLWGWIENFQHRQDSTGPNGLYRRAAHGLHDLIVSRDPNVVVATEVGMCELFALIKRCFKARFRLVGVITGVDVDRAWSQPEVDLYAVSPGDVASQLEAMEVPRSKILACGQPVDPGFASLPGKMAARSRLQLDPDLPLLLVLFGGAGMGKPQRIAAELQKVDRPFQAAFVTGRNPRLQSEVRSLFAGASNRTTVGWVDNMHEWMAAADILITKPGSSTLVEALNCGLPLLALDPLPGNERRACDWIEKWGVGYWMRERGQLASAVTRLLDSEDELRRLRAQSLSFSRPHAAAELASAILA